MHPVVSVKARGLYVSNSPQVELNQMVWQTVPSQSRQYLCNESGRQRTVGHTTWIYLEDRSPESTWHGLKRRAT